jgi:predicted Zn finger-like uncharacterized protein
MYTQCPDCHTAFPVTARVLQQAAGRVRCGRCGQPFNALESLSEDPPESGDTRDDSRSVLDALEALAGPEDIRIEDTGVEWRVIDEDDVDSPEAGDIQDAAEESDRSAVRWYIEDDDQEPVGNHAGTGDEAPQQREDEASLARRRAQQSLRLQAGGDEEELRYDDNTPLPDDFGEDVESYEPPRRRAEDFAEPRSPEFDERQVDLALGDPGEWMALLDELGVGEGEPGPADELLFAVDDAGDTQSPELAATDNRLLEDGDEEVQADPADANYPRDIDTQFDLQALEMGIDLTGSRAFVEEDNAESALEHDGEPGELALATDGAVGEPEPVEGESIELRLVEEEPEELELATDTDSADDSLATEPSRPADHAVAQDRAGDEAETGERLDKQRPAFEGQAAGEDAEAGRDAAAHEPVPLTDEELTVNRLIDQDLLRFAKEQDALGSTTARMRSPGETPHVETIIMEGEFVRTALDGDEDDSAAPGKAGEGDAAGDLTWLESRPATQAEEIPAEPRSWSAVAGVFVLGLLLLVQVVHAYRESLATNGAFERTAAPVYRLLGTPLVPNWDARGWQFQATSGSTDATGDVLSISSRMTNESSRALPYPLIYLSLTDRWEEPVGASVLEPIEYLAPDADTTTLVAPGESFDARITIRSLSPDASGFKLNVCYPADAGRLRCAIEDFRK